MLYKYNVFEFNKQKRDLLIKLRDIDIVLDAPAVMSDKNAITQLSPQKGEIRYKTIGILNNKLYAVIHTPRNGNCRIITMRRAQKREEKYYYEN